MANYRVPVLETFSWQPPVNSILGVPPESPEKGDRYIVGGSPTGAWVGHAWNIATYNGASWTFDVAAEGWSAYNHLLDEYSYHNGTIWTTLPPSAHVHAPSEITGTAVVTNDSRLSDARAPTSHGNAAHSSTFITAADVHSNANDPAAGEKSALAGTSGTPSGSNKYVTNEDGRLASYDAAYKCLLFTI
jgi:hypothetical protein